MAIEGESIRAYIDNNHDQDVQIEDPATGLRLDTTGRIVRFAVASIDQTTQVIDVANPIITKTTETPGEVERIDDAQGELRAKILEADTPSSLITAERPYSFQWEVLEGDTTIPVLVTTGQITFGANIVEP